MGTDRQPLAETLAKQSGWCRICRGQIVRDEDYIARLRFGWVHAECAHGYVRAMEENREADEPEERWSW